MTREEKIGAIVVAILLVCSFAVGRYTTPVKVKTETKIVTVTKEVEKKSTDNKKERHKNTTTTEVTHPDGTKETTTVVTDDTDSENKTNSVAKSESSTTTDVKKEVTRSSSPVTLSILGGTSFNSFGQPIYGGSLTKPLLGPLTVGFWGLSNGTGGVSLGLTF